MTETRSPIEIDTRLAALYEQAYVLDGRLAATLDHLHGALGDKREVVRYRATGPWGRSHADVLATDPETVASYERAGIERLLNEHHELTVELAQVEAETSDLDAVYRADPWPRFFLCMANGGHIHSSLECRTLHRDTRMSWLPTLSGRTEADAVAEMGPALCTVCYRSAPVEYTGGELHITRLEREARKAENDAKRDAKRAKKAEKALFADDPDREIQVNSYTRVGTILQANSFLKSYRVDLLGYGKSTHPQELADGIAEALAARLGSTVDEVWATVEKKAQAQHRKDIKEGERFKARNPHLAQYFKETPGA